MYIPVYVCGSVLHACTRVFSHNNIYTHNITLTLALALALAYLSPVWVWLTQELNLKAKEIMEVDFSKNRLRPGDPGYVWDKAVDFGPAEENNDWDEDDDDEEEGQEE